MHSYRKRDLWSCWGDTIFRFQLLRSKKKKKKLKVSSYQAKKLDKITGKVVLIFKING